MAAKKVHIVYDVSYKEFQNNKIFDCEYASKFPGAITWAIFAERIRKLGWDISTSDIFLKEKEYSKDANFFCISEMISPYTFKLFEIGIKPLILICGESPNVAWRFYHKLDKYSSLYDHVFLFRGVQQKVNKSTKFHTLYWPNLHKEIVYNRVWKERQFAVMVASNKHRFSGAGKFGWLKRSMRKIFWIWLSAADPIFKFEDLYKIRLNAIMYFSNIEGFRLFGTGWDEKRGLSQKQWMNIKKLNPVRVEDKLETMSHFKFAFCFENCSFPGYITEKIFDCFFAGCIPIYCGAPDIEEFIPKETFIHYKDYNTFNELSDYLINLSESEAKCYLDAANEFIRSKPFEKFTVNYFVNNVLNILETETT